ncbi:MAG TPA: hypothetical protein VNO70_25265 [Blastocatellia bacterium]|nr:hypothetical protein [Blastocatellia bacterium]
MGEERRIHLLNEIKEIERELYLKRSQLASEAKKEEGGHHKGLKPDEWRERFSRYIEQIGLLSAGGNSVEDIIAERQR